MSEENFMNLSSGKTADILLETIGTTFSVCKVADYSGTKDGYTFRGWLYDNSVFHAGDVMVMLTEDIRLVAVWDRIVMHHVTYDTREGSSPAPGQEDVEEGQYFVVKDYDGIKEGYEFSGWQYGDKVYIPGDEVLMNKSDIVLRAYWTSNNPEPGTWDNPMLMFLIVSVGIGVVLEIAVFLYFRRN